MRCAAGSEHGSRSICAPLCVSGSPQNVLERQLAAHLTQHSLDQVHEPGRGEPGIGPGREEDWLRRVAVCSKHRADEGRCPAAILQGCHPHNLCPDCQDHAVCLAHQGPDLRQALLSVWVVLQLWRA